MLGHYLSVAALTFRKSPIVAIANIVVLALGLTGFVATYAATDFWNRAERQFSSSQRTFIISSRIEMSDGSVALYETPATNSYLASHLPIYFPEIEAVARARSLGGDTPISVGSRSARLATVAVDAAFLEIFDLPFIAGDRRTALAEPRSVILTESAAERLFGADDPIGLTVSLGNRVDAIVTGVVKAISEPSHLARSATASLPFDVLASMDVRDFYFGVTQNDGPENWFGIDGTTYVLLPADQLVTAAELQAGVEAIVDSHMPEQQAAFGRLLLQLVPVTQMLALEASGAFLGGRGSITTVLWLLGSLVLGVACLSYASLATARAAGRAHEVGVRKAIGANASDVVRQYLLEAGLLTAASLALAVVLVRALSPVVQAAWGIDLSLTLAAEPRFFAFLAAVAIAVTLLAGAYPAFLLSRVRPIFALHAYRRRFRRKAMLPVLVGAQFTAATFLLLVVAVIYFQNAELRRIAVEISTDPLLVIENRRDITGLSSDTLHEELRRLPQVLGVAAIELPLLLASDSLPLARSADEGTPQRMLSQHRVSHDFASVMQIELLAGRFFERERDQAERSAPEIVIDRELAEFFGFATPADAIGEVVYVPKNFMTSFGLGTTARPMHVIGVLENKPLSIGGGVHRGTVYRLATDLPYTIVRVTRNDVTTALEEVDELWRRLVPGIAVHRRFVDEIFANEYASYARIANAMTALCSFAVLIAIIGLAAMIQVVVTRRRREIAVRKVLGAGTSLMVLMLLRGFALLVLAGSLAAWPVALIAMRNYLDRFASPIELDARLFVGCLLAMLLLATLTVGAQALHAARSRPTEALRHE
jgi:putative ABC transport system permease protein